MEFELLNELVENGYEAEDLDELYEFCVDYILEYENLVEDVEELEEGPKQAVMNFLNKRADKIKGAAEKNYLGNMQNIKASRKFAKNKALTGGELGKRYLKRGAVGAGGLAVVGGAGYGLSRRGKKEKTNESAELLAKLLTD